MSILAIISVAMSALSLILHAFGKTSPKAETAAEITDAAGKVIGSLPAAQNGAPKAQDVGPVVAGFGPARDHRSK